MRHKNLELAHIQRIKLIFYYSEGFATYFHDTCTEEWTSALLV